MAPFNISLAKARFNDHANQIVHFVEDSMADAFLNELENYPKVHWSLRCCRVLFSHFPHRPQYLAWQPG
jgi:hypothetical protein